MSKYIDLNEATDLFKGIDATMTGGWVADTLEALPTINIVRCYNCKHYKEEDVGVGYYQWCELLQREVEIDWYCASGEREDNE